MFLSERLLTLCNVIPAARIAVNTVPYSKLRLITDKFYHCLPKAESVPDYHRMP